MRTGLFSNSGGLSPTQRRAEVLEDITSMRQIWHFQVQSCSLLFQHLYFLLSCFLSEKVFVICFKALISAKIHCGKLYRIKDPMSSVNKWQRKKPKKWKEKLCIKNYDLRNKKINCSLYTLSPRSNKQTYILYLNIIYNIFMLNKYNIFKYNIVKHTYIFIIYLHIRYNIRYIFNESLSFRDA